MNTLLTAWEAQFILRYHTSPIQSERQTVGAHSYAVSVLVDQLWPDASKQVILAALYHDVPELILGDIPATAKWDYPELKKAFEKAEAKVMKDLQLEFNLSPEEKRMLKMADMLELVLYSSRHLHLQDMEAIMESGISYLWDNYSEFPEFKPVEKVLWELQIKK